jgi:hypothetical protein
VNLRLTFGAYDTRCATEASVREILRGDPIFSGRRAGRREREAIDSIVRIDIADAAHWNIPDLRGCEATSYALDRRDGVQRENGCSASSLYQLIGGGAKNGNGLNLISIQRQQRFLIAQQNNAMGGKQTSSFAMRSFRNSMGLSVVIK